VQTGQKRISGGGKIRKETMQPMVLPLAHGLRHNAKGMAQQT
jgi:hypothetical protein